MRTELLRPLHSKRCASAKDRRRLLTATLEHGGALVQLGREAQVLRDARSLSGGTDYTALIRAIQCHQAFARERHFEGADQSPLYIAEIAVLEPDGEAIRLLTEDEGALAQLRSRSRSLVVDAK